MGYKKEEKDPQGLKIVTVFFRDGSSVKFHATDIEINRMVDEIVIFYGDYIRARFFSRNIAGYMFGDVESAKGFGWCPKEGDEDEDRS